MMIDISRPGVLTAMSSDELCEAAYRGLIECKGVDLSSFVEKVMQGVELKLSEAYQEGRASVQECSCDWEDGYEEGVRDGKREAQEEAQRV